MSFELEEATIADIQAAMRSDEITARSLVEHYVERIDRYDDQLDAVLHVNADATDRADELDAALRTDGPRGPLHGVPVILKDNYNTHDMPTTGGSKALAGFTPPTDAFIVRRLREAGAIMLAKANLHELARGGTTVSSLGGQTRNPYDLDRTPGGSSGGTGAAVAANFGAVGFGSDTVNSIRSPASACCLVGLRPTQGLVSRAGLIPVALSQDMAGPMTRTVADAAILLGVIAGYDPDDPVTARSVGRLPEDREYARFLDENGLRGARLGVLHSFFGDGPAFDPVNEVMEPALADLEAAGVTLVDLDVEWDVDELIDRISVQTWEFRSDFEAYLDELGAAAPLENFDDLVDSGKYHSAIEDDLAEKRAITDRLDHPEYLRRLYRAEQLRRDIRVAMANNDLDAIVFPHQKRPVAPIGDPQRDRNGFLGAGSGFPAITVPAGFTDDGIPVGIEFLARPFEEPTLLALAHAYERTTQHRRPPDAFSSKPSSEWGRTHG